MPETITWTALEHEYTEKSSDWFWALGIVAISSALVAILFKNFLFAILILIGSFTLALLASRPPQEMTFTLTSRGVMVGEALYPYDTLVAFWVQDRDSDKPILLVDAQQILMPHIIVSLENTDAEQVHAYLLQYLPEQELHEPFGQRLFEMFGF